MTTFAYRSTFILCLYTYDGLWEWVDKSWQNIHDIFATLGIRWNEVIYARLGEVRFGRVWHWPMTISSKIPVLEITGTFCHGVHVYQCAVFERIPKVAFYEAIEKTEKTIFDRPNGGGESN